MPRIAGERHGPGQENPEKLESQPGPARPAKGPKAGKAPDAGKAGKAEKAEKIPLYLTNLPTALIKFGGLQKQKITNILPMTEKPPKREVSVEEEPCALGPIVIPCCQVFNNIHCYMVFYCVLVLSQGILFSLVDLNIANFQKDYNLKLIENFALAFSYDISSGLVAIFVAFYGEGNKKIKWIVVSSFLIGFGSLLFAYPFINSRYNQQKVEIEDICKATKVISPCRKSKPSFKLKYLSYFILGLTVQGIAGMPLYILGITFLDDSVKTRSLGTYIGIADASSTLGYALGYVIGAPLVQVSENNTSEINTENGNDNPQWMWSWWSDFLFTALVAWSTLIPLSCFPNSISGTEEVKAKKQKEPQFLYIRLKDTEAPTTIKNLPAALWILMKNPVYMCLALSKATESLVMIGVSEILPIYIENQFILTRSFATMIAGLVLLPGSALGQLLGGIIVSTLEMSSRALMIFVLVTSAVSLTLFGFIIFIHCDPGKFAGITEDYDGTGQLGNLTAPCNEQCRCSSSIHNSICGRDDIEYFSPCFAGCTYSKMLNKQRMYYNCSCIKEGLITADGEGEFIDARRGKCDAKCYKLPLFIAFISSVIIFSGFSGVPLTVAIIRILPDKLRSLALGVNYVIVRIFGSIPGPLAFKFSGENSCTFRDINTCGRTGHCWIYNKTRMAYLLVGICSVCKILTITFTSIAFVIFNRFLKKDSHMSPTPVKKMKAKRKNKEKK
uniref:Solute carrier organic anion transporter family member n=1 Tax=Prolemur simus TaxID=1328070 RepID=A0A8C8ZH07_PROSS